MEFYYCRNRNRRLTCKHPIGNVSHVDVPEGYMNINICDLNELREEKSDKQPKQLGWYLIADRFANDSAARLVARAINEKYCDGDFTFVSYRINEKGFVDNASIETSMG